MFGDRFFVTPQTSERPSASRMGVGHGLERREGFRRNYEKGLLWTPVAYGFREVCAIDVRNETKRQGTFAVILERLVCHHRPEVGPADADVDDVADALTGVAGPCATPDTIGQPRHSVQNGVHLRYHVLVIDNDGCSPRSSQSCVQDRSILCNIDFLATEHGF